MPADGHPEDTYYESSDDEGQAATDEIDAFEARLRGDAPPAKKSAPLAPKVPQQKVAVKKGSDYVNSAGAGDGVLHPGLRSRFAPCARGVRRRTDRRNQHSPRSEVQGSHQVGRAA